MLAIAPILVHVFQQFVHMMKENQHPRVRREIKSESAAVEGVKDAELGHRVFRQIVLPASSCQLHTYERQHKDSLV